MENYEKKLLSIKVTECPLNESIFSVAELISFSLIKNIKDFETTILSLVKRLPFQISKLPSFGLYVEDWFKIEVNMYGYELIYCERGSYDTREKCEKFIDIAYEIFRIISPTLTKPSEDIALTLDKIVDQRLMIWLKLSSEIYHMFLINRFYGYKSATKNITWMCEELVRMGVADNLENAFNKKDHMIKGITLSGLPISIANEIYYKLRDA
jgi:hypothetical protein